MKKTKQATTQNQSQNFNNTSTYGFQAAPDTEDVQALRNFQFVADPSLGFAFGSAKNQIGNSFNNPIGGFYSPQQRDSILRSTYADLGMKEAQAKTEANQALQGLRFGQKSTVAALTAPRLVQTGSSGSGTSQGSGTAVQSSPILPDLLVGGATGAAA